MKQELNLIELSLEKTSKRISLTREQAIKQIIEALLFSTSEAVPLAKIREIVSTSYPANSREIKHLIHELTLEYQAQNRAFQIDEIAGGYLLRTIPSMHPYLELLLSNKRGEKLSAAATEVLAVIAYRGPITRREVEKIRGVDCSGTIYSLVERGLVEAVGRADTPGRPMQYGITKLFLQHFGLKNLNDLGELV